MNDPFFYRFIEFDRATLDDETRSIEVSLSSETPVQRWFGSEILLHGQDNVDLSRLDSALMNHDPNQIIGRWEDKRITKKTTRATLVFDDDAEGNRAMAKVKSGSLKGVSVRYSIIKFRELQEKEEWNGYRGPAMLATKWQPVEGSLTPIPADPTVGVGRDATRSLDGIDIERSQTTHASEVDEMTREEIQAMLDENNKKLVPEIVNTVRAAMAEEQRPKIRVSAEEFNDMLSRASAISPDAVVKFSGWVAEGKGAQEIQRGLLDLATAKPDASNTGGNDPTKDGQRSDQGKDGESRDVKKFSDFTDDDDDAFIRGLTNPQPAIN